LRAAEPVEIWLPSHCCEVLRCWPTMVSWVVLVLLFSIALNR